MPETEEQRENRLSRELEGKNVAYYQTLLSAWIHTRMEGDRAVITLSAAAIGLLVTILAAFGISSVWQRVLIILSFVGFVGAICVGLQIYELNADHLVESLKGGSGTSPKLESFDKLSKIFFGIGLISMIFLGLVTSFSNKGGSMSNDKSSSKKNIGENLENKQKISPNDSKVYKSLSGVGKLSPPNIEPNVPSEGAASSEAIAEADSDGKGKKDK